MDTTTTGASADSTLGTATERGHTAVDRVAQTAHEAIDRIAGKAGPAVEKLRASTGNLGTTLRAKADNLGELEEQWVENTRGYIRENPLTAIAIGVLAGVLLSKLSSSR
jgi:ElaB/YqjD/DUF883 family membrane-anchored ribosome-binding protein